MSLAHVEAGRSIKNAVANKARSLFRAILCVNGIRHPCFGMTPGTTEDRDAPLWLIRCKIAPRIP